MIRKLSLLPIIIHILNSLTMHIKIDTKSDKGALNPAMSLNEVTLNSSDS